MTRAGAVGLVLLIGAVARGGAAEEGRVVEEIWEIASLDRARIGSVHTTVRSTGAGKAERLRAASELNLTLRRYGALVRLRMEHGTEETAEGKAVGVFMRQYHAAGKQLVVNGTLDRKGMHIRVDNGRIDRHITWPEETIGLYRLEHLFARRKPEVGERFHFRRYEPTLTTVVTVRVVVKGMEAVVVAGGRKQLLRVELTPDRVEVPRHKVALTPWVWWLDGDFVPVRRQFELEGLGTVTLTRSTAAAARAPLTAPARVADIGLKTLIPLKRAIPNPYATRSALYRVRVRGDADVGSALISDGHQEVRNIKGDTLELLVHPVLPAERAANPEAKAPAEYLVSCPFVDSADAEIKALARRVVGGETDPWRKALHVEKWVKANLRVDNATPLARAGQVARTRRGDCRHYALLTAALCRAEGVPSRTAFGLLYVERGRRPQMGFHMWTEVWVAGRWLGLDATLGRGGVSATHVKISDNSWHKVQSLTPLLPVTRVLGKLSVEIVRSEAED
jgi:transglutaminase-like putative cysteine protease